MVNKPIIKIVFATASKLPSLTADDQLAIEYLRRQEIEVEPRIWDSDGPSLAGFSGVVIRSCWDYHLKPQQFLEWLSQIESQGVPVWNPVPVVAWNLDKHYLKELSEKGVPVPPTVWLEQSCKADLAAILEEQGWGKAVVKPTISATAFETWITTPEQARLDQAGLEEMLKRAGVMVQQFVPEVQTHGEWSFIFFGGAYSHAVLKRARQGEFRVQDEYGGYLDSALPPDALIEQAARVVDRIEHELIFARVDGIERDNKLYLMELELIEPFLYLGHDPLAVERFGEAIISALNSRPRL